MTFKHLILSSAFIFSNVHSSIIFSDNHNDNIGNGYPIEVVPADKLIERLSNSEEPSNTAILVVPGDSHSSTIVIRSGDDTMSDSPPEGSRVIDLNQLEQTRIDRVTAVQRFLNKVDHRGKSAGGQGVTQISNEMDISLGEAQVLFKLANKYTAMAEIKLREQHKEMCRDFRENHQNAGADYALAGAKAAGNSQMMAVKDIYATSIDDMIENLPSQLYAKVEAAIDSTQNSSFSVEIGELLESSEIEEVQYYNEICNFIETN